MQIQNKPGSAVTLPDENIWVQTACNNFTLQPFITQTL